MSRAWTPAAVRASRWSWSSCPAVLIRVYPRYAITAVCLINPYKCSRDTLVYETTYRDTATWRNRGRAIVLFPARSDVLKNNPLLPIHRNDAVDELRRQQVCRWAFVAWRGIVGTPRPE